MYIYIYYNNIVSSWLINRETVPGSPRLGLKFWITWVHARGFSAKIRLTAYPTNWGATAWWIVGTKTYRTRATVSIISVHNTITFSVFWNYLRVCGCPDKSFFVLLKRWKKEIFLPNQHKSTDNIAKLLFSVNRPLFVDGPRSGGCNNIHWY